MRRGELGLRADVWFNLPLHCAIERRIRTSRHPVTTLGDESIISKLVDGPFGTQIKVEDYRATGIPVLRVSNCRENEVSDNDLIYISPEHHNRLLRSEVLPDDVVFTKTGHVLGYAAVFPNRHERANMTSHLVLMRPTRRLSPHFLVAYLRTAVGQDQVYRWGNKATKPELNTIEIRRFLIPVPDRNEQDRLLQPLNAANRQRKKMLADADALLDGLDGYMLKQLGLTLPPADTHRTIYAIRLRDATAGTKLYPDYFHPERINAITAVQTAYPGDRSGTLASVADFIRNQRKIRPGDAYLGLANIERNTGERVDSTDDDGEGIVFEYAANDVLFARLRPYLNKVYRAEYGGVCSTEFHVMRVNPAKSRKPRVVPDYLAAVLRSRIVLSQTRHMMTGNTHPRLANDDVVNLVIPLPQWPVQCKIAAEVARRRDEARRLRSDASALWEKAKGKFEAALLAPPPAETASTPRGD